MSLVNKAAKATRCSAVFSLSGQILSFIVSVVMARILMPKDFGLFAIVIAIAGFARMFQDIGIGAALIQRKEIDKDHEYSAFWAMLTMGIFLYILTVLIMGPVSIFYADSRICGLLLISASIFVLNAFITVPRSLLSREMNFKVLGIIELSTQLISSLVMISLAISGWGVWSLAIGSILFVPFSIPLYYYNVRWVPKLRFNYSKLKELFDFGIHLSGAKVVGWTRKNSDYMIIGKILGAVALGYYALAYKLVTEPINRICSMIFKVFLPAFSSVQDDQQRLSRGYLLAAQYLMIIVLPVVVGIIIIAPEVVYVLFGKKWAPVVPLIRIMGVIGLTELLQNINSSVLYAKGLTKIVFRFQFAMAAVLIGILLVVAVKGIIFVAWMIMLVSLVFYFIIQQITNRELGVDWQTLLSKFIKPGLISTAMSIVILIQKYYLHNAHHSEMFILLSSIVTGIVFYLACIFIFDNKLMNSGVKLLLGERRR